MHDYFTKCAVHVDKVRKLKNKRKTNVLVEGICVHA